MNDEQGSLIVEWAYHCFTEAGRWDVRSEFNMRGRSFRRVLEASEEYQESKSKPYSRLTWNKKGWDWEHTDLSGKVWKIIELTTGKELFEEGRALRHCVSGYAPACHSGHCAIFSLKCEENPRITIEITLASKTVNQARGTFNRPANREEMDIIRFWKKTVIGPGREDKKVA